MQTVFSKIDHVLIIDSFFALDASSVKDLNRQLFAIYRLQKNLKIGIIGGVGVMVAILFFIPMQSNFEVESGNDAAKFCLEKGGLPLTSTQETIDGEQIKQEFCEFSDGSKCPLWEFYNGECTSNS